MGIAQLPVATIGHLLRHGHSVTWQCRRCAHSALADLASLGKFFGLERDLYKDPLTPRCANCGSRDIGTVVSGPTTKLNAARWRGG